MAKVDLHNFFQFYDERNPNHIKAVQWLEDNLPVKYLEDTVDWAEIFRGKKHSAVALPNVTAAPAAPGGISAAGLKLVKTFEGCRLNAYPDPLSGGLPITIGWGCTRDKTGKPFHLGQSITQAEADDLLAHECVHNFLPSLKKIPHWNEMSDGQQGALLSFAFNLGAGFYGGSNFNSITKALSSKANWGDVPDALYKYRNPGTSVEAGLARRRKAEGESWKS